MGWEEMKPQRAIVKCDLGSLDMEKQSLYTGLGFVMGEMKITVSLKLFVNMKIRGF